jgi:putative two-component system response regulator
MSQYSAVIARKMGLGDSETENILYAAPMHDVGKIGIPDRILLKTGSLDADEWETMKKHTVIGAEILRGSDAEFIRQAEAIALTHHEKWDGSGYPDGLQGPEIPLAGRIVAIADVFDALASQRPYKEPFSLEESFNVIKEGRGSHFDPEVVDAFFAVEDEILAIKEEDKDQQERLLVQMLTNVS